jgi:hypothetical protein
VWQLFLDVANAKLGANFLGPWMVTGQNDFDTGCRSRQLRTKGFGVENIVIIVVY